jgi:hypothetical protein
MADANTIFEKRSFRLLPSEEIGFAKPAIEYRTTDGATKVKVSHDFKAPEPEIARKAHDPGYWTITVWLPLGAEPLRLVPDPSAPAL